MRLNDQEREIYEFICQWVQNNTHPPSLREIAQGCLISRANVVRYLDRLEIHGLINREPGRARGITLTGKKPRL